MDKNKLSYYACYAAIACGIVVLLLSFVVEKVSTFNLGMGILFLVIGSLGLKIFKINR